MASAPVIPGTCKRKRMFKYDMRALSCLHIILEAPDKMR